MGNIWQQLWDIYCQNYGIYWPKTIGDISRYICQKLWGIFGKRWDIFAKSMGYIGIRL